jgi:hypothetical protein
MAHNGTQIYSYMNTQHGLTYFIDKMYPKPKGAKGGRRSKGREDG